jgi:WD40 repeat protein
MFIASGSTDQTVIIWWEDENIFRSNRKEIVDVKIVVRSLAVSRDCKSFACGGDDKKIFIWGISPNKLLQTIDPSEDLGEILDLKWSPNGKYLAVASTKSILSIWDVSTWAIFKKFIGHTSKILSVDWNSNGRRIATGSEDKTLRLWDVESERCLKVWRKFGRRVVSVSYNKDNNRIAGGCSDSTIKIVEVNSEESFRNLSGHIDIVWNNVMRGSGSNNIFASASSDKTIKIWNCTKGELLRTIQSGNVSSLDWSNDSRFIASGTWDKCVRVWDSEKGDPLVYEPIHSDVVMHVAFSKSSNRLATASWDNTVKIWDFTKYPGEKKDIKFERLILHTFDDHEDHVNFVSWSPNDKFIASASSDKKVRVWDVAANKLITTLDTHTGKVLSVNWSYNGKYLASSGFDGKIKIWSTDKYQELASLEGHSHRVSCLAWSKDDLFIARGGRDKTIKIWNTGSKENTTTLVGHLGEVFSVVWNSNSTELISGSFDNSIKIWEKIPNYQSNSKKRSLGRWSSRRKVTLGNDLCKQTQYNKQLESFLEQEDFDQLSEEEKNNVVEYVENYVSDNRFGSGWLLKYRILGQEENLWVFESLFFKCFIDNPILSIVIQQGGAFGFSWTQFKEGPLLNPSGSLLLSLSLSHKSPSIVKRSLFGQSPKKEDRFQFDKIDEIIQQTQEEEEEWGIKRENEAHNHISNSSECDDEGAKFPRHESRRFDINLFQKAGSIGHYDELFKNIKFAEKPEDENE